MINKVVSKRPNDKYYLVNLEFKSDHTYFIKICNRQIFKLQKWGFGESEKKKDQEGLGN